MLAFQALAVDCFRLNRPWREQMVIRVNGKLYTNEGHYCWVWRMVSPAMHKWIDKGLVKVFADLPNLPKKEESIKLLEEQRNADY